MRRADLCGKHVWRSPSAGRGVWGAARQAAAAGVRAAAAAEQEAMGHANERAAAARGRAETLTLALELQASEHALSAQKRGAADAAAAAASQQALHGVSRGATQRERPRAWGGRGHWLAPYGGGRRPQGQPGASWPPSPSGPNARPCRLHAPRRGFGAACTSPPRQAEQRADAALATQRLSAELESARGAAEGARAAAAAAMEAAAAEVRAVQAAVAVLLDDATEAGARVASAAVAPYTHPSPTALSPALAVGRSREVVD